MRDCIISPKRYSFGDLKQILMEGIKSLSPDDILTRIEAGDGGYDNFSVIEMLYGVRGFYSDFEDIFYVKPLSKYSEGKSFGPFGKFDTVNIHKDKCGCPELYVGFDAEDFFHVWVASNAKDPCLCGYRISHNHCILCGGIIDARKRNKELKKFAEIPESEIEKLHCKECGIFLDERSKTKCIRCGAPRVFFTEYQQIEPDQDYVKHHIESTKAWMCFCPQCETFVNSKDIRNMFPNIPNLADRVKPGHIIPIGECPACKRLLYPSDSEDK